MACAGRAMRRKGAFFVLQALQIKS